MAAKDNLQPRLFDIEENQPKHLSQDIEPWGTYWHGSDDIRLPSEDRGEDIDTNYRPSNPLMGHPYGFHAGTMLAAVDRQHEYLHPVEISGLAAARPWNSMGHLNAEEQLARSETPDVHGDIPLTHIWDDRQANAGGDATALVRSGKNIVYENDVEDPGSYSVRSPRRNIRTWSERVMGDPYSNYWERKAAKQGADLVYTRTHEKPSGFEGTNLIPPPSFDLKGNAYYPDDEDREYAEILFTPKLVYPPKPSKRPARDINVPLPGMES